MVCWVNSPRFTSAGSRDAASRASRHVGAGEAADLRRRLCAGRGTRFLGDLASDRGLRLARHLSLACVLRERADQPDPRVLALGGPEQEQLAVAIAQDRAVHGASAPALNRVLGDRRAGARDGDPERGSLALPLGQDVAGAPPRGARRNLRDESYGANNGHRARHEATIHPRRGRLEIGASDRAPRAATGAGATGLEPATSGVTGRADRNDGGRRSTRIACKCGTSEPIWDVEARYVLTAPRRRLGHNRATAPQLGVAFLDAAISRIRTSCASSSSSRRPISPRRRRDSRQPTDTSPITGAIRPRAPQTAFGG